ncbi:MAG TPA: DNA polymerase III subunit delta [Gaiellaceae bacterium]|jgi:DNA polymerase-3 subunit delta
MATESLRPVYLLTGSDRPKRTVALQRLRARFGPDSVELLSADSSSGPDAVASANALGLFGDSAGRAVVVESVEAWRKADVDAIRAYLDDPTPDTVLVLVADELRKDSPLEKLAAGKGEVLRYDVPRGSKLVAWAAGQFKEAGVQADGEAARALVEIVGEDPVALAAEVSKIADWADGDPVGRREVEQLATPGREAAAWAVTDAWGARDLPAVLEACELALEKKDPFLIAVNLASHVGKVRAAQALAEEGLAVREIASRLRMKEFPARKALQQAERYSRAELDAALVRLAELDAAIKGASRLSAELELVRALVEVTQQPVVAG